MTRTLAPFFSLLLATSILLIGNGLLGTLIPLRGGMEHFATATIGGIGSVYFAGFLAGCVLGPHIVRRAGHIRSFAALAGVASVLPLMHVLVIEPFSWAGLRAVHGFCFAGLYMVIESWLNERATNETRGRLFSVYLVVNLSSITLGQLVLNTADPAGFTLFAVVSILTSLALVPISLTTSVQPAPIASTGIYVSKLYKLSPVGLMGSFVVGLTNAPFWTLGPLFAKDSGLDIFGVSIFMTAAIIGGAVAQWPIGRLSDKMDRRLVILGICIGSAAGELALIGARATGHETPLLMAGFLFGVFSLALYSVCVAHTNDHASRESFVSVSGGLLLVYAVGAIIGPSAASLGTSTYGMSFIFMFGAAVHLAFAVFTAYRIASAPALDAAQRADFVAVPFPPTDPTPPELDPRAAAESESTDETPQSVS
ncbi:MAG: MFS transporter [Parvibaculum sp.]|uniref:MFS transporter n=1 Tax=Parvibaculum sp. TaxID=2024848 RepID=UPI0025E62639|nr:MFS transporter [Parvibaculum sp.]MCE9651381.1 MFS transporter [Parvibaculum sp.]